ncbi:hypothetical protein [Pseudoroseicyclus tamaricis]|uniref:Uncharacterized protein n=1 Tax=Pseudoroseicyclus tamaricis TaxID=2705421 RepID=A0A6B2JPH2_9RHOB|nr:hypothetical protein [Pseudoroseicyclus tamaricis]NDV00587.1 hypothetical protein [Pseudoroseicyclus tamaricis]
MKYLTGERLAKRIRKVMAGGEPWMCVAFLGPTWAEELFEAGVPPEDLRVVCDLRMGGTVRGALSVGGAPGNDRLRHLPEREMHAKVYASDKGAVVCSANASRAALSSGERIEDGVWLPPKSKSYRNAVSTFEKRYRRAVPVDAFALTGAPEHLSDLGAATVGQGSALTSEDLPALLQLLHHDPEAFRGVRFVFSDHDVSEPVRNNAKAAMAAEEQAERGNGIEIGARRSGYDYFANWEMGENEWPVLFISVYRMSDGNITLGMRRFLRFLPGISNGEGGTEDVFVAANVR